nr:unnamed protein product [Digitaria exilis]
MQHASLLPRPKSSRIASRAQAQLPRLVQARSVVISKQASINFLPEQETKHAHHRRGTHLVDIKNLQFNIGIPPADASTGSRVFRQLVRLTAPLLLPPLQQRLRLNVLAR